MRPDKPSNTALIVAAGLQLARPCAAHAHLMPREAVRLGAALLRAARPRMARLLKNPLFAGACRVLERVTLPGILLHYALRKQRLRQHAHAAIAAGCTQVVVLGAGLDTISMELKASYPAIRCIEIDHPATQAVKRAAAGKAGQGIAFIPADLGQRLLSEVLRDCPAFERAAGTLYIAEGLLMYLPIDAVEGLFAQMTLAAPTCHLAFTWFAPQSDGQPNFKRRSRLVDLWLELRSEPFLSGLPPAQLQEFLAASHFELQGVSESIDLLGRADPALHGRFEPPLEGEYICWARSGPSTA